MVHADRIDEIKDKLRFSSAFSSDSGKIWVLFKSGTSISLLLHDEQFLHMEVRHPTLPQSFFVTAVYAKCRRRDRQVMWNDLLALSPSLADHNWLLVGDFNTVASIDESVGPVPLDSGSMNDFVDFLHQIGLTELPTQGGLYTWVGVRSRGRVWRKLDRALFSSSWLQSFPNCSVELLSRLTSDHSPILIKLPPSVSGLFHKSFKFQSIWTRRPELKELIQASWSPSTTAYGMQNFVAKLIRLKGDLIRWNTTTFGNVFENLRRAEAEVKQLESIFDSTGAEADLIALNRAQAIYLRSMAEEEDYWRQKAHMKWQIEGDRNTRFFHATVASKHARLSITKLKDNGGNWVQGPTDLGSHVADYYQTLFSEDHLWNNSASEEFLSYIPQQVTNDDNINLLKPVALQEVHDAVFALSPDSAAGSDGFSGIFYQKYWDIIADDLLQAVQEFFAAVPIPKWISNTLLVLIPKRDSPVSLNDFRPISLCNFLGKVFTRILCDRMQTLLPRLVSSEQTAFLKGRDISDNVLLAQELLQHLHRKARGNNILFKLDMMKAFDRVSWRFLDALLLKFGFHGHFVQLILNNLSSSWFTVLLNGISTRAFKATRGLKQGDPLSPILFILVVEALGRGLKEQVRIGKLQPYSVPRGVSSYTHLMFADDLMIFTRGTRGSIQHLFSFLARYEAASGQCLNKAKSSFVCSRRASSTQVRLFEARSGIHRGQLPFKYLGNFLYSGRCKKIYFQHIIDSVRKKLSGWKSKLLSIGGRLILIKHVLSSIPNHVLAVLQPPKGILQTLERIFSNFLWGSDDQIHRRSWRTWQRLAYPTNENGLGVRSLSDLARAYSCKLWWKWRTRNGLWAQYVHEITLVKSCVAGRILEVDPFMRKNTSIQVHSGSSSLLFDKWSGQGALVDLFDITLDYGLHSLGLHEFHLNGHWQTTALCEVLPQEAQDFVQSFTFDFDETPDTFIWAPSTSGLFSISTTYDGLRQRAPICSWLHHVWNSVLPIKISLFTWRLTNGLLPFPDILSKMGFQLPSKCPFGPHLDSIQHCFFACPIIRPAWEFLFSKFGVPFRDSVGLSSVLQLCWSPTTHTAATKLLSLLPQLLCWTIWKFRNKALYEDQRISTHQVIAQTASSYHMITQHHPNRIWGSSSLQSLDFIHFKSRGPRIRVVRWFKPPPGSLKLNVDGSLLHQRDTAGGGFLLRNSAGHLIFAASEFYGSETSFHAEILALTHGLRYCIDRSLQNVYVECDSKLLVDCIFQRATRP